ncbi:MAG: site-specific integrase [Pseudomonadota bacterium]
MAKSGQARVPTSEEKKHLFDVIQEHRYPEKNTAIMQISFKLGLRAQEIALLELKEVCQLGRSTKNVPCSYKLLKVMPLPASYTKGADALGRSKSKYERKTLNFSVDDFDVIVRHIEKLAIAGAEIVPSEFYPSVKKHKGKSRDLPMVDTELRHALEEYLNIRLDLAPYAKPGDPLFLTQKGNPYSPNTLQEHMALMLRGWAGIEKASSHSGRRALITDIIHNQKKSVKVAQIIAGHKNASTTIIYEDPPEVEVSEALKNITK